MPGGMGGMPGGGNTPKGNNKMAKSNTIGGMGGMPGMPGGGAKGGTTTTTTTTAPGQRTNLAKVCLVLILWVGDTFM
jgi:hypothetical protein